MRLSTLAPASIRLRPTPSGKVLLGVAAAALVFAWSRVGPLFAVMAVFELGIGVAAALATWRHASRLRIVPPGPATAFARERVPLPIGITTAARHAMSFDVLATLRAGPPPQETTRAGTASGRAVALVYVPSVAPGEIRELEMRCPALRRGRHPQGRIELESTFPLGFAVCRLAFVLPDEIVVLPRLGTIRSLAGCEHSRSVANVQGDDGPGDEQEIYGVRSWREGESLRPVHWKLSARRGRLLVREFRSQPLSPVRVVLATAIAASPAARDAFEDAVSLAATLVEHHVRRGHAVRLDVAGKRVDCRRQKGGLLRALRVLADVQASEDGKESVADLVAGGRPAEVTYLVRAGSRGGPALTAGAAELPVTLRRSAKLRVLDVCDRGIEAVYDRTRRTGHEILAGLRK